MSPEDLAAGGSKAITVAGTLHAVRLACLAGAAAAVVRDAPDVAALLLVPAAIVHRGADLAVGGRQPGPWGQFLTSVGDRIGDGAVLAAIAWVNRESDPRAAILAVTALSLAFLAAYAKVRAESLGLACSGWVGEAPERLLVLALGLFAELVEPALWALIALGTGSVLRRSAIVWRGGSAG